MDIKTKEIDQHCKTILSSPRIRNKLVILCEGDPLPLNKRESVSFYASMEKMPDSNFYKSCIPSDWKQYIPQFFNCGSRSSVIKTFFRLLELHNSDSDNSYLYPDNLYAIVDLDIQKNNIDNYSYKDTEEIYENLYKNINIEKNNIYKHKIFVTGLIHKEAYFLLPELKDLFDNFKCKLNFSNNKFDLNSLYLEMINDLSEDKDLVDLNNFEIAKKRISFNTNINSTSLQTIKSSWLNLFNSIQTNSTEKNSLIYLLLLIKKVKMYWEMINSEDWTGSQELLLENLILEVGNFISNQKDERFHIIHILNFLREKINSR